jgi:hypothetical protein
MAFDRPIDRRLDHHFKTPIASATWASGPISTLNERCDNVASSAMSVVASGRVSGGLRQFRFASRV